MPLNIVVICIVFITSSRLRMVYIGYKPCKKYGNLFYIVAYWKELITFASTLSVILMSPLTMLIKSPNLFLTENMLKQENYFFPNILGSFH